MTTITKVKKIDEVKNEYSHNFYYMIFCRVWNKEQTRFYRLKFVLWFDTEDLYEYYEKDRITAAETRQYLLDWAANTAETFDYYNLDEAIEFCNNSLKIYYNVA